MYGFGGPSGSFHVPCSPLILPSLILFYSLHIPPSSSLLICNNSTDYQCVCQNDSSSHSSIPQCNTFIKSPRLATVDMRVRHVNLEASLHTGEKYESYFKRRIANIVSAYCERNVNECPGTGLRLNKPDDEKGVEDSVLYGVEQDEDVLSQDNVLLLQVDSLPHNLTRILFDVVRTTTLRDGALLSQEQLLDPVKVKYILGSSVAPLSRVLGGIRIDSVRVSHVDANLRADAGGNDRLLYIVGCVAAFFITSYIIGFIRLYKMHMKRKKKSAASDKLGMKEKGTMKRNSSYGATDVTPLTMNNNRQEEKRVHTQAVTSMVIGKRESMSPSASGRPRLLSERQARLMFVCDPSQLPKELSMDDSDIKIVDPPHPSSQSPPLPSVPILVNQPSHESPAFSTDNPIHRPKSRRGSRVDDTGETIDLTERLPFLVQQAVDTDKRRASEDAGWSSSEGEMDVYYKLSEEEDVVKGDEWPRTVKKEESKEKRERIGEEKETSNGHVFIAPYRRGSRSQAEEEDSSEDEERKAHDEDDDDSHVYTRLVDQSSPIPHE